MRLTVLAMVAALVPAVTEAQHPPTNPWQLRTRAVLSGSSDTKDSLNYKVYSGLTIEAAIVRDLGQAFAIEMAIRAESREVEGPTGSSGAPPLGSLEIVPISLIAQWRPLGKRDGATQPYIGAGSALSLIWEKSGVLNTVDVPLRLSPAVQFGVEQRITSNAALNADIRWNMLRVDFTDLDPSAKEVKVDPLALGLGVRLRF